MAAAALLIVEHVRERTLVRIMSVSRLYVSLPQNVRLGLIAAKRTMAAAALLIVEHVRERTLVLKISALMMRTLLNGATGACVRETPRYTTNA